MIEKCALILFSIIFRLFGDHWRSLALVYIFAGNGWTFSSFKNRFLSRPTYVLTIQHQAWNMSFLNWVLPASVWNCYFPTNQKRIWEIERTKKACISLFSKFILHPIMFDWAEWTDCKTVKSSFQLDKFTLLPFTASDSAQRLCKLFTNLCDETYNSLPVWWKWFDQKIGISNKIYAL